MKKITKILFPTDFSEPALNAFRYALLMADRMEAKIEVLNVVFPQGESLDFPEMVAVSTQKVLEVQRTLLKKFIENGMTQVLDQLKNAPEIVSDIEIGTPIESITFTAKRDDVDMIMIGSRGDKRSGIEKLMGSIAAGVVKKAHCPVLVIPEKVPFEPITQIAFASNTLESDPFEIWKVIEMLKKPNLIVHCVHFNYKKEGDQEATEHLETMKEFFDKNQSALQMKYHNLPGTKLEDDLNEFVENNGVNMLIMHRTRHSFWERIFKGSATRTMTLHTHVPLLVLK